MLRFISRFLGFWLLAAALVAAVVDGAKSIAASMLVTTPLAETSATLSALLGGSAETDAAWSAPWPFDVAVAWLMAAPTALVVGAVGVFFLIVGAKRRRKFLGREYVT